MIRYKKNKHANPWTDQEVEKHWDSVADIYIEENIKVKQAHDQRFKESIRCLELKPDSFVLNITSRDCEANDYIKLVEDNIRVINAEISQGLINVASNVRPYAKQVKLENYSSLPFEDSTFNRIISLETLEHVADPIQFLSEFHRVSTADVRLVLSCPPATSEIPYRIFTKLFGGHGEGPHRFMKSKEVKIMLKKTGWKLLFHKGTILIPIGPSLIQNFGDWIIKKCQDTFIAELGIRQFYICEKY